MENFFEIKLIRDQTNPEVVILTRAGQPLLCPYATRVLVPGNIAGSYGIDHKTCNSQCPLLGICINDDFKTASVVLCDKSAAKLLLPPPVSKLEKI